MVGSSEEVIYGGFYSPPFMQCTEGGFLEGPLIDLSRSIAQYFHLNPVFENISQEQLNNFGESNFDVGLGIFKTQLRAKLGEFSYSLIRFGLQGLGLEQYGALDFDALKERGIKFGAKEGDVGHDFLLSNCDLPWLNEHCIIIPATSSLHPWNLLKSHDCDVILSDTLTLPHWQNELVVPTWPTFCKPIHEIDMCFLISKRSRLGVGDINYWLAQHANTHLYSKFLAAIHPKNQAAFKPCTIPVP